MQGLRNVELIKAEKTIRRKRQQIRKTKEIASWLVYCDCDMNISCQQDPALVQQAKKSAEEKLKLKVVICAGYSSTNNDKFFYLQGKRCSQVRRS